MTKAQQLRTLLAIIEYAPAARVMPVFGSVRLALETSRRCRSTPA